MTGYFVKLPNRGQVVVEGPDCEPFLQNITTQDMRLLARQPLIYSCLLSPQGKFLHDVFIRAENDSHILECEGGDRTDHLLRHMKPYKIGRKVTLSAIPEIDVYAATADPGVGVHDPRHPELGWRSYTRPANMPEASFADWDIYRLKRGIPDGSRDMDVGKDVVMDCGIDKLNGVSFDKGCYVGQEITARMNLRGLVKKHLRPIEITVGPVPAPFTDIHINGALIGQMRSSCGMIGLALIRDDALPLPESAPLRILGAG